MSRHRRQQRKRARRQAERLAHPPTVIYGGTKSIVREMQRNMRKSVEPIKHTPTVLLLAAVNKFPGRTSGTLAKLTGTTVGTASTTLRRLHQQGKVSRSGTANGSKGYTWHPPVVAPNTMRDGMAWADVGSGGDG
jgi:hypothetical protein